VMGLGYVGLPLAVELARAGYAVVGLDVDPEVADGVNQGRSHVRDVPGERLRPLVQAGSLEATTD
ncbi:MAG: UDP-N-acetyl-D-glucosamine dehydrogenase, partial [Gemmatimonadetes bacterium]|nr:UDP-N-acetyl-D-glucosamine dehydrogenase [Gemmatimonadota bacterium]NIT68335.1 UDP-N-acetyl-D-glucosamine dehydrogenase [Gemmatimonadota bacterium]NIV22823.1 UDP-N-acetyl-D-glucosamine dehydrogenase [Gemmatimonadota bacterium]NIW76891.1 UDP-N-acetyl-D-glucosamine dehydrogenase [Gemmatimonadota bacterium]NIY36912.1 UDP-N-acetyl-D-glucosamine dehydrogenase [Gemmatimonadota bacterium]